MVFGWTYCPRDCSRCYKITCHHVWLGYGGMGDGGIWYSCVQHRCRPPHGGIRSKRALFSPPRNQTMVVLITVQQLTPAIDSHSFDRTKQCDPFRFQRSAGPTRQRQNCCCTVTLVTAPNLRRSIAGRLSAAATSGSGVELRAGHGTGRVVAQPTVQIKEAVS